LTREEIMDDIEALRRWTAVLEEFRIKVLNNVFCSKCYTTTVVDYSFTAEKGGVLIKGKCCKCGKDVARFVEDI